VELRVAAARRDGELAPVVFLHGCGSTKEDYLDIANQQALTGRPFLAYDAPGCGGRSATLRAGSPRGILNVNSTTGLRQGRKPGIVVSVVGRADPQQITGWRLNPAHVAEGVQRVVVEDDLPDRAQRLPLGKAELT